MRWPGTGKGPRGGLLDGGFAVARACGLSAVVLLGTPALLFSQQLEPADSGPQDPGSRSSAPPLLELDHGLLRTAYLDLVGRPPFARERELWLGRGLRELVGELRDGSELWDHWLQEQLYYFLLIDNFRPDSARMREIPALLAAGRLGLLDSLHRIAISPGFDRRNPGADTFVTVIMEQLLGITVQKNVRELEIGKSLYDGEEGLFLSQRGHSQADVVRIAIEDKRCARHLLRREYERILRADPDRSDLAGWARELRGDRRSHGKLLESWMLSDAYRSRISQRLPMPNRLFVRTLFVDLLDRLPTPDEQRRMRNALDGLSDPRPLRSVIVRLLLDSKTASIPARDEIEDPTRWIGGLFRELLGRSASAEELRIFVETFREPECRPETVVYALLTHPEYHHY